MRFSSGSMWVAVAVAGVFAGYPGSAAFAQRVIYVDASAAGANDGSSWADAYTDLQDALTEAGVPGSCTGESPCGIWVAAGIYTPGSPTGDCEPTFRLLDNVGIYGGFAGWETALDQRDWETNETILSGDLLGDDGPEDCPHRTSCCVEHDEPGCDNAACKEMVCGLVDYCCHEQGVWNEGCVLFASVVCCGLPGVNKCDNSYHVVTAGGTDETAVLDGFTIADGNGYPETIDEPAEINEASGGGMLIEAGSPTISNCTFRGNRGFHGGAVSVGDSASPTFADCLFVDNRALSGAGVHCYQSDITLMNCTFRENAGGTTGLYTGQSSAMLINCTFERNVGSSPVNLNDEAVLIGCTFTDNVSGSAGAVDIPGFWAGVLLSDCTFVGNTGASAGAIVSVFSGVRIERCTFVGNSTGTGPGAVHIGLGDATFVDSTFRANSGYLAGAVHSQLAEVAMVNCAFTGNVSDSGAGAVRDDGGGGIWLTNCTFAGNRTVSWRAAVEPMFDSYMRLTNCILWGNSNGFGMDESAQIKKWFDPTLIIDYSVVQGWTGDLGGTGNFGDDPLFVEEGYWEEGVGTPDDPFGDVWVEGDYSLQAASPCIDTGNADALFLSESPSDLAGHPRILCTTVDRGAYEFGIGDYNCDGAVELCDFSAWASCMTGPDAGPYEPGCEAFDFNADDAIDLTDFAAFQNAFTGGP